MVNSNVLSIWICEYKGNWNLKIGIWIRRKLCFDSNIEQRNLVAEWMGSMNLNWIELFNENGHLQVGNFILFIYLAYVFELSNIFSKNMEARNSRSVRLNPIQKYISYLQILSQKIKVTVIKIHDLQGLEATIIM